MMKRFDDIEIPENIASWFERIMIGGTGGSDLFFYADIFKSPDNIYCIGHAQWRDGVVSVITTVSNGSYLSSGSIHTEEDFIKTLEGIVQILKQLV